MNKNLVIIAGVWNDHTEKKIKKYLSYCEEYDIIISSDKKQEVSFDSKQIIVPRGHYYSYKCLEWAQQVKSEIEIKNFRLYGDCFFIDANGEHDIELPNKYEKSMQKGIVCFNPYKNKNVSLNSSMSTITQISSEFWYAKSIDFDFISKIWKSGYLKMKLDITTYKCVKDYVGLRLYFYCRLYHFNFIYGNDIVESDIRYDTKFIDNRERPNNKIRVAICLSGEIRSWELTGKLWNNYHTHTLVKHPKTKAEYEIEYDFFISTWECMERNEIKNNLKNLRGVEFLKSNSLPIHKNTNLSKMTYLNQRCNLLKIKYENLLSSCV